MANDRRGPSEYAQRAAAPPPRKTRFVFKFLGLLLVALAAWLGSYIYRTGKLPDVQDPAGRQKLLDQAGKDASAVKDTAADVSGKVVSWANRSLDDLRARIKDKPPETAAEQSKLVDESKKEIEQGAGVATAGAGPAAPSGPGAPESKGAALVAQAREEYRAGLADYAKTDPAAPQEQVQKYVRLAEPHFSRCLDLLEKAREQGAGEGAIDTLEQSAARRLYDCRKRMELRR